MRKRLSMLKSKRLFKQTANRTKQINIPTGLIPRGGIRL